MVTFSIRRLSDRQAEMETRLAAVTADLQAAVDDYSAASDAITAL
jgi:hypothetical protein